MRVAVVGATGRMGVVTCRALLAASDLELVGAVARRGSSGGMLADLVPEAPNGLALFASPRELLDHRPDLVVDFSVPEATVDLAEALLPQRVHVVSGTTGLTSEQLGRVAAAAGAGGGNAVWAPNFALGAVLAAHFAAVAARFYDAAEVIELHHDRKVDAPSGTALRTAEAIAGVWQERSRPVPVPAAGERPAARGSDVEGVAVHAVRLPGLVAHQEVLFGGTAELLTIRHDSFDRTSFMPGVLLAVRAIADRPGLTVGLAALLGLEP